MSEPITFRSRRRAAAIVLSTLALACGDDPSSPAVAERVTLRIRPDVQVIELGDTLHLAAHATNASGDSTIRPSLTWRSSDPAVATVTAQGVVRGVARGSARIVAFTAAGDSASAGVTVTPRVASVRLTLAAGDSQPVGSTYPFEVDAFDATGARVDGLPFVVSASDSNVVVDPGASAISIIGVGDATLTVRVGSGTATHTLRGRIAQIGAAGEWSDVDVGDYFACALAAGSGLPHCWGMNFNRRLGYSLAESRTPRPVDNAVPLRTLAVGYSHSCGLAADSTAWCWGTNGYRQLGAPTPPGGYGMVQVDSGRRKWLDVDAGGHGATCGIGTDTLAYCWGHDDTRQLARGERSPSKQDIAVAWEGRRTLRVSPDQFHSCMLDLAGAAHCSGLNGTGLGPASDSVVGPRAVLGGHVFTQIETGFYSTCGLLPAGEAMCWGWGPIGSVAENEYVRVPTPVAGARRFVSISVGLYHACALTAEGEAWCWGAGPLGASTTGSAEPVRMRGAQRWRKLVVAGDVTCGITTDERLLCLGDPRVANW